MPKGVYQHKKNQGFQKGRIVKGELNYNWKGGVSKNTQGYLVDSVKRYLHRVIWEENFGKIPSGLIVHHKNGDKTDNRIENLEIMSRAEHNKLHDPMGWKMRPKNSSFFCIFADNKPMFSKGLCRYHYQIKYRKDKKCTR
jgi:hypothetical protein